MIKGTFEQFCRKRTRFRFNGNNGYNSNKTYRITSLGDTFVTLIHNSSPHSSTSESIKVDSLEYLFKEGLLSLVY